MKKNPWKSAFSKKVSHMNDILNDAISFENIDD